MNIGIDIDGVLTDIEKFMMDYGTKFCLEEGLEIDIKEIDYSEIKTFHWTQEQADKFWEKYLAGYVQYTLQREFASDIIKMLKDEGNKIYRVLRVKTPQEFTDILEWHDYVKNLSGKILSGKEEGFTIEMERRDFENIANFSCIPWVDFDMITNCAVNGQAIQPLITWGKVNEKYEMSISITVSHIFVNGRELGYFYENAQKEFNKF